LDVRDQDGFAELLETVRPDVVHNLAAMTSVGASWESADEVEAVDAVAVEDMVEVLLTLGGRAPVFVHASSAEIFGPADPALAVDEATPIHPVSPYGEAKARAHAAVRAARGRGLRATNLVLFGHTSALHPPRFAIPSLARQAAEVAVGDGDVVALHNPATRRDWGSAPDFVRAFVAAAKRDAPAGDFVIATGTLATLAGLARRALSAAGASEADVVASGDPVRPHDFDGVRGNASLAARSLGWSPARTIEEEVEHMVAVELSRLRTGAAESASYLDREISSPRGLP
jgi:GDPmannose 4,6-dehydratase